MAGGRAARDATLTLVTYACGDGAGVTSLLADVGRLLADAPPEILIIDDTDGEAVPAAIAAARVRDRVRLIRRPPGERVGGQVGALVRGARLAHGAYVGILEPGWRSAIVALPALLAACRVADLAVAVWSTPRAGARRLAIDALWPRARICGDPFSGLFVCRRAVLREAALVPEGAHMLLHVLVCGAWSRLAEVNVPGPLLEEGVVAGAPRPAHIFARELHRLAWSGGRRRGRVWRIDPSGAAPRPEEPEPLDADLPDTPPAGPARMRLLWQFAIIALVVRLSLLPLGHPWDTTTFYNMFIELGHNRSPYDSMRYLSSVAQAAQWGQAYEGYAYPPGPIYLYYPLARLFVWLHPTLTTHYAVQSRLAVPTMPLDFYLWLKLPFWLGDLGIAILLWRMTGTTRTFRNYLLNPYVILVSTWTFDSLMVLGLLLSVYWLQRGRLTWSALALAFGTILKFVPGFALPTLALFLIQRKRPMREVALFLAVFVGACVVSVAPFLGGVLYVTAFHGARQGGGMQWQMVLAVSQVLPRQVDWYAVNIAVGTFSTAGLVLGMLLAYRYVFLRELSLNQMVLITLLAYLISTKLVNEQYVLALLPFSYIELHALRERRHLWRGWRRWHVLLWVTPLVFAVMRVPIDQFLLPLYHTVFGPRASLVTGNGGTGFVSPYLPWYREPFGYYAVDALALWFTALCVLALVWLARHRAHADTPAPALERPREAISAPVPPARWEAVLAGAEVGAPGTTVCCDAGTAPRVMAEDNAADPAISHDGDAVAHGKPAAPVAGEELAR